MSNSNINDVIGHSTAMCDEQNGCVNVNGALICPGYSNESFTSCFDTSRTYSGLTGQQVLDDKYFRAVENMPGYYPRYTEINTSQKGNAASFLDGNMIEYIPSQTVVENVSQDAAGMSLMSILSILSITVFIWVLMKIFQKN